MAANTSNRGVSEQCVLNLTVGQTFEETLEFTVDWPEADQHLAKEKHVEMVLDLTREPSARPRPAKGATVKTMDIDVNVPSRIQNMPSGRHFLIRGVVALRSGRALCSDWVRARTLPETKPTAEDSQDINGDVRGKCRACPCKAFRWDRSQITLNSGMQAAICRGCGCASHHHAAPERPAPAPRGQQERQPEEAVLWRDPATVRLPAEAHAWEPRERDLFLQTSGRFHPRQMAAELWRPAKTLPQVPSDIWKCRISVVCPTTDQRHEFHEQLYSVFQAQQWEDLELVVVETYKEKPSAYLQDKSKSDDRFIYVSFKVDPDHDWSIGLKRNVCTHLASGFLIANFDDDDLYAPSYMKEMVRGMVSQQSEAITLSNWYVFDVNNRKFGIVDAKNKSEEWLFGYGFSYVFMRQMNLYFPYPDCNMGEDYAFFKQLRKQQRPTMVFGGWRHVGLLKDEDGLCCHTLHPKATSGSYARSEVPPEEVPDLCFSELGLMEQYMRRFPQTGDLSRFIRGQCHRTERKLQVWSSFGSYPIACFAGTTALGVAELLAPLLRWAEPADLQLHRSGPHRRAGGGELRWEPGGEAMVDTERIGRKTTELWVTLPLDRGEPPDVEVRVADLRDASVRVRVQVHRMARLEAVRHALIQQHGQEASAALRAAAKAVRLAEAIGGAENGTKTFMACDLSALLGEKRELLARGLAEMLGQPVPE